MLAQRHDEVKPLRNHYSVCARELHSNCFYNGQCEPVENIAERIEDTAPVHRGIGTPGEESPAVVATDQVREIFADARALQADALEMLALDKVRNAAEKAWGATKRATDAWSG